MYVVEVAALLVVRMNERIELAKLEFHRRTNTRLSRHGSHLADDPATVLQASLVIVRHVQDEQILEVELTAQEKAALDSSAAAVQEGVALLDSFYSPG